MLIYAAIGASGFLFLLIMLFVGELFGADHDVGAHDVSVEHGDTDHGGGPSVLSARVMASFLTAFGVGGVVARYYKLSHPVASGVGVVSGIVLAGIVYQFARILYSQQASSEVRMTGLVGKSAEVTVAIPQGGVGQIALSVGGERTEQIARSDDGRALPRGAEVVISGLRGETVIVAPAGPPEPGGSR
ncbi:MAG TPA: NfeD family protein [Candidatus Polarisedimenticolia bacterium]|jgi:membrane protein implicated in regulation of membrane protease activity